MFCCLPFDDYAADAAAYAVFCAAYAVRFFATASAFSASNFADYDDFAVSVFCCALA
jgi:hypothetical protein